jgi:hypothetical protein
VDYRGGVVPASFQPQLQLFVCTNRRDAADPLGEGCGARGEEVYAALKRSVTKRGAVRGTWVSRTHCLGVCPRRGATVARSPALDGVTILSEVDPEDVDVLLTAPASPPDWSAIEDALAKQEMLEAERVLDLARRLHPGLTAEDIRNPHDFPALEDTDWHYADGVLTGIQSAANSLRAMRRGGASKPRTDEGEPEP